ncbi:O-antigen ligase family protein [Desulfosporosinus meridiei]|uniref:Lipid A core-O-antigen ligase-like enyme n=1 Tax=Desulfosporosinus meridiei (strain ATCC BAA-275 / DSM 13257 / KCTC 12902 / NCIMB 13706 / S10) TaxID=768704 RepID=J7IX16_DESMD|nr:O-antigen ligase family protein [Desulfosporosinus meridiei]AFQ46347.1 hypothetical protein Desmer_4543 [Desulfosporosinus meridiei DSM 13257]
MIGASLQQDIRARSNTVSFLALFLGLSLIAHGLYYPQEWLLLGLILSLHNLFKRLNRKGKYIAQRYLSPNRTDAILLGLVLLSLLGLLHPVKFLEGIFEGLHWAVLWLCYRLGMRIALDDTAKKHLLNYIEWLAVGVAFIGWLPWVSKVGGRLSSVFGYPNATAAFLGAVLLMSQHKKPVVLFLFISLLGTGSRAGVGLFLLVFGLQQILIRLKTLSRNGLIHNFKKLGIVHRYFKELWIVVLGIAGIFFVPLYYKSAWENLIAWGFTSSSWQERIVYFKDGILLAWNTGGLPQAGGWWAFPTVQHFPYWTADPHSSFIHVLLNQGVLGIIGIGVWGMFSLVSLCKTWVKSNFNTLSEIVLERLIVKFKIVTALIFLVMHSLLDADFSFGALGVLFWLLVGTLHNSKNSVRAQLLTQKKSVVYLKTIGIVSLRITLCLVFGGILLDPKLAERNQIWNLQAVECKKSDPNTSIELWTTSLKWDQTQVKIRQELAEHLLKQGDLDSGLDTINSVISWQPFEIMAYEWAQSVAWAAAELNREAQPEMSITLYRWVESVPLTIERRAARLSELDRKLWPGHKDFLPTEHIKMLADNARQRQLTQLLPKHKL